MSRTSEQTTGVSNLSSDITVYCIHDQLVDIYSDCYVVIDTTTLKGLDKVWVPEDKWFNGESSIAHLGTAKKTLQFAQVQGKTFNELFILSDMLKAIEHELYAQCFESIEELHKGMTTHNLATSGATIDYTSEMFAGPMH